MALPFTGSDRQQGGRGTGAEGTTGAICDEWIQRLRIHPDLAAANLQSLARR